MDKKVDSTPPNPVGRPRIELTAEQAALFGYFRATYDTMDFDTGKME